MKKLIFLTLILSFLVSTSILAEYDSTISYLKSQSQDAWITQALSAAQADGISTDYVDTNTDDLMTAVKNLLALTATNSQDTEGMNNLVQTIQSKFVDNQLGSAELLNDDFWGLIALSSVKDNSYDNELKSFILSHQNEDGGWSWSTSGASDSNDTAAAIMALLETDLTASSAAIVKAVDYLKTTQNSDGGFGYDANSQSDGASTAWILASLNKLGVNSNDWLVEDNTPISFLDSLALGDGSFKWMATDEKGSAMVTAFALLSLSNTSYPVKYITLEQEEEIIGVNLRLEGPEKTICLATNLEAANVLQALALSSELCDFEYIAEDTAYGIYVFSIAGIPAEGMSGWQFWVNWQSAMVGAADYTLNAGDNILWAFGEFGIQPTKVEVNQTKLNSGEELTVTAQYYTGDNWQALVGEINIGNQVYNTDTNGQFSINLDQNGIYPVYVKVKNQYIRSNKEYVTVGDGVSQTVDLLVKLIEDDGGGGGGDDSIAFTVNQSSVDFGELKAGQSTDSVLTLTNSGNVAIYLEADIVGDSIFTDYIDLNQADWQDWQVNLSQTDFSSVDVKLSLPDDLVGTGAKSGQLIFWATTD